jgi:hypothetical protein
MQWLSLTSTCNPGSRMQTIKVNHNPNRLKQQAEKRLKTKKGSKAKTTLL